MTGAALRHLRHLPRQVPVVASFGRVVLAASRPGRHTVAHAEVTRTIAPLDPGLIRDYVVHVGGEPSAYRTTIPPHFFPHWGLALAARTLVGLRYPLARIINSGCRLECHAPLPAGTPLVARARLISIDDDGRRVRLEQRLTTGTAQVPEALVAILRTVVPLASGTRGARPRAEAEVPHDARELASFRLARDAGLTFALLTGDFNPIHWSRRAGAAAGFGGPILHGFAMLARAIEGIARARFAGDVSRVRAWDARFTRPLRLPAEVALFARERDAWLGRARGGAAYLALAVETA